MRLMYSLMSKVSSRMADAIDIQIKKGESNRFEFRNLARKYAVDVIATTAFGIEINSFDNPENDFMVNTSKATNFASFSSALKFAGFFLSKPLMKFLGISFFSKETVNFFTKAIVETMNIRQKEHIVRHDFIELMMQAKRGTLTQESEKINADDSFATVEEHDVTTEKTKRQWDDSYLVAQSFGFFFAGFETVKFQPFIFS